jgi:hypothetical protein
MKGKAKNRRRTEETEFDVPGGIIVHLTMECGGDVRDWQVVHVTSGSFEKETFWALEPVLKLICLRKYLLQPTRAPLRGASDQRVREIFQFTDNWTGVWQVSNIGTCCIT